MEKTKRELLQEAANLLKSIVEREQTAQWCRAQASKLVPGQSVELQSPEQAPATITREELLRVAGDFETEIASTKQRAKALQDQALAMKG